MSETPQARTGDPSGAAKPSENGRGIRFLKEEKKRKGPKVLFLALLLLVAGLAYAWFARAALLPVETTVGVENPSVLVDRLWVDKVPESDRESFSFYIFSSEENIALNDKAASTYRHLLEIFFYRATARDLQYQFPHDRRSGKTGYAIEKLSKPEKNQIDLKLTIVADPQSNNETKVYYSSTKWSSVDRASLPAPLRAALSRVPAADLP